MGGRASYRRAGSSPSPHEHWDEAAAAAEDPASFCHHPPHHILGRGKKGERWCKKSGCQWFTLPAACQRPNMGLGPQAELLFCNTRQRTSFVMCSLRSEHLCWMSMSRRLLGSFHAVLRERQAKHVKALSEYTSAASSYSCK